MLHRLGILYTFLLLLLSAGCSSPKAWVGSALTVAQVDTARPAFSYFLAGDAGSPLNGPRSQLFDTLKTMMGRAAERSALLFLGDNIYPAGLPDSTNPRFALAEEILLSQLKLTEGYTGQVIFLPVNHDWKMSRKGGMVQLRRQEDYIERYYRNRGNRGNIFLPDSACPGPVTARKVAGTTLLVIDTEWWLQRHAKPQDATLCGCDDDTSFLQMLETALMGANLQGGRVLLAAHHPMYSQGQHGGHFTWKDHLFPLRWLYPKLYIPVPVVGSLIVAGRKLGASRQDIANPRYTRLQEQITSLLAKYPGSVYISGHEHNLQYHTQNKNHFIISGSGSKSGPVRRKGAENFGLASNGIARLDIMPDGSLRLTFIYTGRDRKLQKQPTFRLE